MSRTVPLSIIRSFSLYTQKCYMSYRFADSSQAVIKPVCHKPLMCVQWKTVKILQAVIKPVWHIPLLCVQWKTPDNGQRNYPKHVEFYSKNKFEKLMNLVCFIIRKFNTMHGHVNVKQTTLFIFIFKALQRHVSALRSHLQAEHKRVYIYRYIYTYIHIYIYIYTHIMP